jgi:16S rRNA (uracil1498-N3)-methyltransferase
MNLLLLHQDDFINPSIAVIRDQRRCEHILHIQKANTGDKLKVGVINGLMGSATILQVLANQQTEIHLDCQLTQSAPAALPLTIVMALPRPKMFRRVLQTASSLGIKSIYFIHSYRVEKSYWQSPFLNPQDVDHQLILGLEQSCDTRLPEVHFKNRFKPFVEDELPDLIKNKTALVAHPYTDSPCPVSFNQPLVLAIGPEGGFIPYEIELLKQQGFSAVHLGERILRVETALPFLTGRLFT